MPYTHFLLLLEYMGECKRIEAKYNAVAFNAPSALFSEEKAQEAKYVDPNDEGAKMELLREINGK